LDKELEEKALAKTNPQVEEQARAWITNITKIDVGTDLLASLRSGVILCTLANKIFGPNTCKFVAAPKHFLEEQANITCYLEACQQFGVPSQDMFTVLDIGHSAPDKTAVLQNIFAVARQAQAVGFDGPILGVRYYKTLEEQNQLKKKKEIENQKENERREREKEVRRIRRAELENQKIALKTEIAKSNLERLTIRREMRVERGRIEPAYQMHESVRMDNELDVVDIAPVKYGMDLELEKKMEALIDYEFERIALDWIEDVTGEQADNVYLHLKSGRKLCKLINKLHPDSIKNIQKGKRPIHERENISMFLTAARKLGIRDSDLFTVADLYDAQNLQAVVRTMYTLSRVMQSKPNYSGPLIEKQYIEKEMKEWFLIQDDPNTPAASNEMNNLSVWGGINKLFWGLLGYNK